MTTSDTPSTILRYLEPRLETYIQELRHLCAIECPTAYKPGVDEAGAWVRGWSASRGWEIRIWEDSEVGDSLVVTVRRGSERGAMILLVAHLDTVYPVGIAAQRPLTLEGDRLTGPGSADNKSGLLSGLYAMAALQDLGLLEPFAAISLVAGGDEESTMRSSQALLEEIAPAYDVALVLEAGRENGDIVSGRKGSGQFVVEVEGHEAHAGVEPEKGANAILALSGQIVELQRLNGIRPGTTVNVGVVSGGTSSNVVPGRAQALVDVRIVSPSDMEPVAAAIENVALNPGLVGTKGRLMGGWRKMPMPRTHDGAHLADLTASCARELGFEVRDASTGGVSYANVLAGLNMPVLDGLGPVGGLDHSPEEYVLQSSILPRTAMLTLLMLRRAVSATKREPS